MLDDIKNKSGLNFSQLVLPWILISSVWAIYVITNLMTAQYPVLTGATKMIIHLGLLLAIISVFFILWRRTTSENIAKLIFMLLANCL